MPTTRPGFIWSGTEWVAIGQEAVLAPVSYQATAPSSPATGDIWIESDVDVPSIDSAQFLRWRKTMTGGETSLSGNDDSSLPLAYTPGYEQLYINGVLQVRGGDYTATTGTTVTGLTALVANDVVEIFSAVARTVADVYTQTQSDARFVNKVDNGLVLVKSQAVGSAVSSVTVTDAFSATYNSYKIIYVDGTCSASPDFNLSLGGITTGYFGALQYVVFNSGTTPQSISVQNAASWSWIGSGNTNAPVINCEINNPFAAKPKTIFSQFSNLGGASSASGSTMGMNLSTSSATAFTITPSSGTITGGTVCVYGYNKGA